MEWTPLGFRFARPEALWLLLAVPALTLAARRMSCRNRPTLRYPAVAMVRGLRRSLWARLTWLPPALRTAALALLVVALARPQFGFSQENVKTLGVDIILTVDLSDSMRTQDFRPNRLAVAKDSMKSFIEGRPSDNIGIVAFADIAAMLCPLTPEYDIALQFIDRLDFKILGQATALGDALMLSTKRLEGSPAKSKVIVLMTDGRRTAGQHDPLKAAEVAAALGLKVYTIGIGSDRPVSPLMGLAPMESDFDEATLKAIAGRTGARYFHASDAEKFEDIFREIDTMEKTRIEREVNRDYEERMAWFAAAAAALLLLETLLAGTRLRRIP